MKFKYIFLSILSYFLFTSLYSQTQSKYPQDYFRSPIEGRIYLSGTFGELRSNHFHAGIDIKTGGSVGKNIYAAAEGWVSRVKISPWGYGNAIYIEHPNGFTTVYGHLKELKGPIAEYINQQQNKKQKFAVDIYLKAHQFEIAKNDIIALSGNSGGSGGPHIHFEIRETATQEPINPLLFGIEVKDFITPLIKSLRIFPAENGALIQGKNQAENFILKGWGKNYTLKNGDSIIINGDFYLGISAIDKQNDSHNKNGVYQIKVFADSVLYYYHNVERTNFSTSRYINALIDYEYYKTKKRRYQRTYISPNNKLGIYHGVKNNGIFSFNDSKYHQIKFEVKDVKGNTSILNFTILSLPIDSVISHSSGQEYNPLAENTYKDNDIEIYFPARCLYDTLTFDSVKQSAYKKSISPLFQIGKTSVGLQKSIQVKLNNIILADSLKNKVYVGEVDGKQIYPSTAKWEGEQLVFKTRSFGKFGVFIDSIPPSIQLKTKADKVLSSTKLVFIVKDKESGISNYNAWLNGKWALLQWDPKTNSMFYQSSSKFNAKDTFKVVITDKTGNISKRIFIF